MVHFKLKVQKFVKFDRAMRVPWRRYAFLVASSIFFLRLSGRIVPNFLDVCQAFRLWTRLACIGPAQWVLPVSRPDGTAPRDSQRPYRSYCLPALPYGFLFFNRSSGRDFVPICLLPVSIPRLVTKLLGSQFDEDFKPTATQIPSLE